MGNRPPRTTPSATELTRVQKILEAQPAFQTHLGAEKPVEKRTGEVVPIRLGTFAVAEEMMSRRLDPERARVRVVVRVAAEVFGIGPGRKDVPQTGSISLAERRGRSTGPA